MAPRRLLWGTFAFAAGAISSTLLIILENNVMQENLRSSALRSTEGPIHGNLSKWGPADDPVAGTHLILAAHNDDLAWLTTQPFTYTVMTKEGPEGTPNNLARNVGNEASSYLQFIVEHYDDLPPRMIFAHGHNTSWHRKDMTRLLFALDPMSYEFAGLSSMYFKFTTDNGQFVNCWDDADAEHWFAPFAPLPDPPKFVASMCCATFIVSRERVRAQPKQLYDNIFHWISETTMMAPQLSGYCLEWWWHVIFGLPWETYAPDPTLLCPSNPKACDQHEAYFTLAA